MSEVKNLEIKITERSNHSLLRKAPDIQLIKNKLQKVKGTKNHNQS